MLKVLLADDEYLVRVMLKNCLDWPEHGFEIVGEVDSGDRIVSACRKMQPDLLILDINMPIMNGIDALELLRQNEIATYVIIISGYSEFEYAKRGIRLDAFDYLLKPIDTKELSDCLKKAALEIAKKKKEDQKNILPHYTATDLYRFINEPAALSEFWEPLQLSSKHQACYCVVIEIDNFYEVLKTHTNIDLMKTRIQAAMRQYISEPALFFYNEWNRLTVFLLKSASPYPELQQLNRILSADFTVSGGLSRSQSAYRPKKLLEEAEQALKLKSTYGDRQIIIYQERLPHQQTNTALLFPKQELLDAFKAERTEHLTGFLLNYYRSLNAECNFQHLKTLSYDALIQLFHYLQNHELLPDTSLIEDAAGSFSHLETIPELETWMCRMITAAAGLCSGNAEMTDSIVKDTLKYLHEHMFESDLCLERIARDLHVNPSYLSHIFKKTKNIGISNYIQRERMTYALTLINNSQLKLVEIAAMCGYKDSGYFGKCVKSHFGLSFSQLRDS